MSEEKEEKKKKPISVSNAISIGLSHAISAQAEIMQSSVALQALQSQSAVLESFKRMAGTLQSMVSFNNMINGMMKQHQIVVQALQQPIGLKMMLESQRQTRRLVDSLIGINNTINTMNKMVEMSRLRVPRLTAQLTAIPSKNDTLVRSLLRQIEFLEKELSREKARNKELLALLEEKRKELKNQYVT